LLRILRDSITDSRFKTIQLLVTSREYTDIENAMNPIPVSISMSNLLVEADIRTQVRATLHSNTRFRNWPENLLSEVEERVSKEAKGMYVLIS
jgi:hypothetical protein